MNMVETEIQGGEKLFQKFFSPFLVRQFFEDEFILFSLLFASFLFFQLFYHCGSPSDREGGKHCEEISRFGGSFSSVRWGECIFR